MCLFANKFINNYDDAEDLTQEVFIELWNQRAKFVSIEQVKAFLYLSIKNRCINLKKHFNIREKYAQATLSDNEAFIDEYVIEVEVVNSLNHAINTLPEQQKQVIILGLQGFKNEEIAQNMQISINTVKLYKKIAYKQLRTKISTIPILLLIF